MVQTVCRTKEIPQLLDTVVDAPVIQVMQVPVIYIPVVAQRLAPMVRTVRLTMRFPSCFTLWSMPSLCWSRTNEIPQFYFDTVIDVLLCLWCEFTGAVVEKTVVLPRLHEKLVLASVNTAEVSAVAGHRRGCSSSSC